MKNLSPETFVAQAGGIIDPSTGGTVLPIHLASTFERDPDNQYRKGYTYGRPDNATVRQVEGVLAELDRGAAALAFPSGMAAATTVFLGLDRPAHVVAPKVMYWGLRKWLEEDAPAHQLDVEFVDAENPQAIKAAIRPGRTRLVWIETPANPLWSITDIAAAAQDAHRVGALVAVDATVMTPVLTQPISLGADIVMHSATKYLNGHSDVIAGALIFGQQGPVLERATRLRSMQGSILGPFEAALMLRGMRTLYVRVRHQCGSAIEIARHFARHRAVSAVLYPGLESHPGHEIAAAQMQGGFGGMLSVRVRGGEAGAIATAAKVNVWKRATSLGGVESLIEHRASIEGPGSPCPPDLLRLSVGLESVDDLIGDLDQALPRP